MSWTAKSIIFWLCFTLDSKMQIYSVFTSYHPGNKHSIARSVCIYATAIFNSKAYSFDEVIVDSNGKKLDMRFGGNLTAAEEKKTGCLVCLDSCPVGIVSNATYTYGAVEKRGEVKFKGNASVLPADNTLATVTFKITE